MSKTPAGKNYTLNNGKNQESRYNDSYWIVDCPFEGCRGAELYVDGEDFICFSHNSEEVLALISALGIDARENFRAVSRDLAIEREENIPTLRTPHWEEIEEITFMRAKKNKNWELGESLEFMKAENEEYNIPAKPKIKPSRQAKQRAKWEAE